MTGCNHDHSHDHGHSHGYLHGHHGHHHGPANYNRAFAIGVSLNIGFVIVEALYGLSANSVALLADAGHNLSDVLGLILAWAAALMTNRPASKNHTYGFGRSTILASLTNAVTLLIVVGIIAWGAIGRLYNPVPIETGVVIWVAMIGIFINGFTAVLFLRGRKEDINIQGAFLHMAADALISLGVVIGGFVMALTGWLWVDPVLSLVIAMIIALGTFGLFRDSLNLALDAVPGNINHHEIEKFLLGLPGVTAVHDLHIWPLSTTSIAMTAHIVRPGNATDDAWVNNVSNQLQEKFKINHTTLQVEMDVCNHACKPESNEVI